MSVKIVAGLCLLLAGFWAATLWRAARNEAAAEAAYPPPGQMIAVAHASGEQQIVHAEIMGQGPDLVLIHGASGSTRDFTFRLMPILAERYRVVAFDRPGLGYTPALSPGQSISEQAVVLAAAGDQLGLDRPLILGQSYGGAVALAWALNRPEDVSGLVLVSAPSNPWTTGIGAYYEWMSSRFGEWVMAPLLAAWVPDSRIDSAIDTIFEPQTVPQGYADHIGPRLSLRRVSQVENALQRAGLLEEISAQTVHYPELRMPVAILHGTADIIVPARIHSEPLSRQLPNATLTLLDGAGHALHHTELQTVIDAIDTTAERAGLR